MRRAGRITAWAMSALAITLIAGCDRSALSDFTPPSSPYIDVPPPPPPPPPYDRARPTELMGGPPPPAYAPPYRREAETGRPFGVMAPIPNPEDMDPAERAQVYGDVAPPPVRKSGAAAQRHRQARPASQARASHVRPPARSTGKRPARALHQPKMALPAGPVTKPPVDAARSRVTAQTLPHAPSPQTPTAPTPAIAKLTPPQTKAAQLGAALADEVTSGSKLDVPSTVAAGEPGVVVLTVPTSLLDRVKAEAGKLGLGVAARVVDLRARLTGPGYVIVPDETQSARLQADAPTSFAWQVAPGTGEKGALEARIDGNLRGADQPVSFPITSITADAIVDDATIAKVPLITVPGFGAVRSGIVVLVGLGILAVLLLSALGRKASERRRKEQRQRARETHADFTPATGGDAPSGLPAESGDRPAKAKADAKPAKAQTEPS